MLILGIETSCDETGVALYDAAAERLLAHAVHSQVAMHEAYGGVVPELASREHLRQIVPIVREALDQACLTLPDVDAVAVTRGPGLIGALLVGVTYGKVLAASLGKPLVPVNHLEGHVHAVFLEAHKAGRAPELPPVFLVVSGGHTVLYTVRPQSANGDAGQFDYGRIGQTRHDAARESSDKVPRLLALRHSGGPAVNQPV